jgi:hypothetical protein
MEAIVGLVHFFVTLCLCGSLLGSPRLLLGSLSTFVDQDECKWAEWSRSSSGINAWNGDELGTNGVRDFGSVRLWVVQCVGRMVDGVMARSFLGTVDRFCSFHCAILRIVLGRDRVLFFTYISYMLHIYVIYVTYITYIYIHIYVYIYIYIFYIYNIYMLYICNIYMLYM